MKTLTILIVLFNSFFCSASTPDNVNLDYLDIHFMGAVIAPTKPDGSTWDAKIGSSKNAVKAISTLSPGGVVTNALIEGVLATAPKGRPAPDIIGYITVQGAIRNDIQQLASKTYLLVPNYKKTKNTYQPNFETTFINWPIYKETFFKISLEDKDLFENDPLINFTVTRKDLIEAKKSEAPIWINVSERSAKNVLFLKIKVTKSLPNAKTYVSAHYLN